MSQMPPLATVQDLADWLGEAIAGTDATRAGSILRLASALVRSESRRNWLAEDGQTLAADMPDDVRLVTLACAARGYTNPEANTSEQIDDGQVDRVVEEAGLYLTGSEKGLLAPFAGIRNRGLSAVGTTRGDTPPCDPERWWINGPTIPPEVL